MAVQCLPYVLAPAGFVHAQVVNVQCAVVQKHRVVFPNLQNAEAVAQHLPVLDGHENGTGVIGEHPGEGLLVIFLCARPEQVGTDAVVDFPHLKQQVNHTGNVPGFGKSDFHCNYPFLKAVCEGRRQFIFCSLPHFRTPVKYGVEKRRKN